jgi:ABC-type siderophore export system fused ATPase/permease subunit
MEQPSNRTAHDRDCFSFSPETKNILVQLLIAAASICGSILYLHVLSVRIIIIIKIIMIIKVLLCDTAFMFDS